jgi:hypothetical protein
MLKKSNPIRTKKKEKGAAVNITPIISTTNDIIFFSNSGTSMPRTW